MVLSKNDELGLEDLPEEYRDSKGLESESNSLLQLTVEQAERNLLEDALQTYKTTYEIAEALQSSQATIARKMKKYGLASTS
ncbi:hypothetical protein [Bacillus sp. JCM 19041]|uniref:hypothetical protein n=1 Tax=Bacillus sp. JCM 19041 TaxID=1460637 RepID=UPI003369F6AB